MTGRLITWCLGLVLVILVGISGCSGVLMESKYEDGNVSRYKIDTGEGWENYDTPPRYPNTKKNSLDEMSIILKREATF